MGQLIDPAVIGKKGGEARAKALSAEELSDQGRNAVNERWRRQREREAAAKRKKGKRKAAAT